MKARGCCKDQFSHLAAIARVIICFDEWVCFSIELIWVFMQEFEAQGGLFIEEADPDEARLQKNQPW